MTGPARARRQHGADGREFVEYASRYLSAAWGVESSARSVLLAGAVAKKFDLVSEAGAIVGDAKYYKNIAVPAAKWSTIAECVWLLQQPDTASRRFMVFGMDQKVADRWVRMSRVPWNFGGGPLIVRPRSRGHLARRVRQFR